MRDTPDPRVLGLAMVKGKDIVTMHYDQVWSITQFYSVDFSQSSTGVKKCVFNKRTIKVCVSCF